MHFQVAHPGIDMTPPNAGQPLWRRLWTFTAPMIAGNVLALLSGTATAAMLGRLVGSNALASNGVIYPITLVCYSFSAGLTSGATILVARARGAGDEDAAKQLVLESIGLSAALGALFAFIGIAFGTIILHALGTPAAIFTQTRWYLDIVSGSMIVFLPYMMYGALLQGLGDSKTPFKMLVAATLLTIALIPLLILGPGPLPRLGVLGAPLAALIAIGLAGTGGAIAVPRIHSEFHLPRTGWISIIPSGRTVRDILSLGIPIAFQYIAVSVSELVLLSIINTSGAAATAAYAAVNQVVAYVMAPVGMIGIATSAFAANEIGTGRVGEVPAIARTALVMMLALTGSITAIAYVFATPVLSLFLSSNEALQLARHATFVMLWSVPVLGVGTIATSLARSDKRAVGPMLANVIGVWLVLLPAAKLLIARHGIIGVWQAYPFAYVAIALMEVAYFIFVWRKMRSGQPQPATA